MRRSFVFAALAAGWVLSFPVQSPAQDRSGFLGLLPAPADADTTFLSGGVGAWNVLRSTQNEAIGQIQYYHRAWWNIRPYAGIFITSRGSGGGWLGISGELDFTRRLFGFIEFSFVLMGRDGDTVNVGSSYLFRSGGGLGYRLGNRMRLTVSMHHLSHAGAFGNLNPGTETVVLSLQVPLSRLTNRQD